MQTGRTQVLAHSDTARALLSYAIAMHAEKNLPGKTLSSVTRWRRLNEEDARVDKKVHRSTVSTAFRDVPDLLFHKAVHQQ